MGDAEEILDDAVQATDFALNFVALDPRSTQQPIRMRLSMYPLYSTPILRTIRQRVVNKTLNQCLEAHKCLEEWGRNVNPQTISY